MTSFELEHYSKFEDAVKETDVEADIHEHGVFRTVMVQKGSELHPVTEGNLLQFRKLNRQERRYYNKMMQRKNENNKDILRQADG